MSRSSVRVPAAPAENGWSERRRDAFCTAWLPALLRGVVFLAGLASPFIVALLAR